MRSVDMPDLIINYGTGRNLLGGVFPLVANAMFTNMGFPAASSLLGGIVRTHFPLSRSPSNLSSDYGL